jgi:hypothetical protein
MADDARHALRAAAWSLGPLALLSLVAPWVRVGDLAASLLAFGCATAAVTTAGLLAPRPLLARPRAAAAAVLFGVVLSLLSTKLPPVLGGLAGALGLMSAACALGVQVGSRVESAGHILPVALLSAAVDLWSVTAASGPTHVIVQTPALLKLLTVRAAIPPSREPVPQIGFGDEVFVALYVTIGARFGLPVRKTAAALAGGIVAAGLLAALLQAPVPALPMLGLAMVAAHPASRRVPARDRRAAIFAAVVLAASVARVVRAVTR